MGDGRNHAIANVTWRDLVLWALRTGGQTHNVYPTLYGPPVSRTAKDMERYITERPFKDPWDNEFFKGFVSDAIENTAMLLAHESKWMARWTRYPGLVRVTDWVKRFAKKGWDDANRIDKDCNRIVPPPPPEDWYDRVAEMAPTLLRERTKGKWPTDPEAIVSAVISAGIDPDDPGQD